MNRKLPLVLLLLSCWIGIAQTSNLSNGLLAFYNFENSINSWNNTYNLTSTSTNPVNYVVGVNSQGSAVSFNADYVLYSTGLSSVLNTSEFTIAFWERQTGVADMVPIYRTTFEAFSSAYFRFTRTSSSNRKLEAGINTSVTVGYYPNLGAFPGNTWNHYVYMVGIENGQKKLKIFKNGALISQTIMATTTEQMLAYNTKFTIGGGTYGDSGGVINPDKNARVEVDNFFIYNRALNAAEINDIYTNNIGILTNNEFDSSKQLHCALYPNPANSQVIITADFAVKEVVVYTLQGQEMLRTQTTQFDVSQLNPGLYCVQVVTHENQKNSLKLVVK